MQAALLQEVPELGGDVEPGTGVAGHVPHKRKGLVCLRPTHTNTHTLAGLHQRTHTLPQNGDEQVCVVGVSTVSPGSGLGARGSI